MTKSAPSPALAPLTDRRPPNFRQLLHEFIEERKQRLIRYATRLLVDKSQAGDVYTEVFFRVLRSAKEDKIRSYSPDSLQTWVYTITRNCCFDLNRSWRSRQEIELQDTTAAKSDLESSVELNDATGAILDAISDLPPNCQLPVLLCKVERLTARAAAEVVGISVPALKSRLYRGLKLLKAWLVREDGSVSYFRRRGNEPLR